jgi:hypothetical protein
MRLPLRSSLMKCVVEAMLCPGSSFTVLDKLTGTGSGTAGSSGCCCCDDDAPMHALLLCVSERRDAVSSGSACEPCKLLVQEYSVLVL